MKRRQLLTALASTVPLAGCTGGQGDPITMLAVNENDTSLTVTVWLVQGDSLAVANTVTVASGEVVLAHEFDSEEWFNQLDVFVAADGSVELNRGRAA